VGQVSQIFRCGGLGTATQFDKVDVILRVTKTAKRGLGIHHSESDVYYKRKSTAIGRLGFTQGLRKAIVLLFPGMFHHASSSALRRFRMRNSTFVVLSFLGLIFLAASLIWMPLPDKAPEPGKPQAPTAPLPTPVPAQTQTPPKATESIPSSPPASVPPSSPLAFPAWPTPKLAFVVTGEQHGYFEPCGCTGNQLGGMSRRAGLFDKIKSLNWTVRGLDAGGISRRTGTQAQLKFETTLEALRELQYVALAMSPEELRLEPGYLLSQHFTDGETPLIFLGANLVFFGSKELGTPLPFNIIEVDGYKVGITSIMSDTIRREVIPDRTADEAASADLQWTDPSEALTDVLKQFDEAKVDFRILLSQSTDDEIRQQAKDFPGLNIIVAADGRDGDRAPEMLGSTRLLRVGEKGKTAGVVGLYPDDKTEPVRYELVTLSESYFSDSEKMTELMRSYQERLKEGQVVTTEGPVGHPSGATFVGASKCGECHTTAFGIWKDTKHAHAFESLDPVHKRPGFERLNGVARTFDPECLSCHVTGWEPQEYIRFRSGFLNEEFAADDSEKLLQTLLAGNQCENCHGPGSRHVELIEADDKEAAIKEVRVTLEQAKSQTCGKCHDADNSPDFDFDKYWEEVKHSGKD